MKLQKNKKTHFFFGLFGKVFVVGERCWNLVFAKFVVALEGKLLVELSLYLQGFSGIFVVFPLGFGFLWCSALLQLLESF